MKRLLIFSFIILTAISCLARMRTPLYRAFSPTKSISFILEDLQLDNGQQQLFYRITSQGETVVQRSKLGLQMDGILYGQNVSKPKVLKKIIDESYSLKSGKQLQTRNHCMEYRLSFKDKTKRPFQLVVRVYDTGVAFRYVFPDIDNTSHTIQKELTEFSLPQGKAWIHPYDWNDRKKPSYEQFCQNGIQIGTKSPYEQGWAFPMLFETNSRWAMVTEACLDGTYPATHIDNNGENGAYRIRFPEIEEPIIPDAPEPQSSLPWKTPWRVIIIGSDLNTIFTSQIVSHLNPPSEITDTDWIKPGKATWSWWYSGATVRQYKEQLKYVDFCREMGWSYSLIDAGWQQMDGEGVEGVVKYAKEKGVGIWLWYHSGAGRENAPMSVDSLRRKEFKRISELGVKGVKVDFFDTDKQRIITLYPAILKDAADFHLMVDFHGATLPRGWERTWPNLMTTEAIKGAESLGRQTVCDRMAEHNATVVFTRNVVGSMDYTPVTFSNKIRQGVEAFRRTSMAHQLALSVAFESGFLCFADRAEGYQALPQVPKDFLKEVPVAWDESRLLAGYPSDYAVIARRKGEVWYIGAINGKNEARELRFSLPDSCIGKTIHWITDGKDINTFDEKDQYYQGGEVVISVLGNGGFVGKISFPNKASSYPERFIHLNPRGSIKNSFRKFERGGDARVAFLGGSITEMKGWHNMMMDYLSQRFPQSKFHFIEAGIPSMGSTPHAFRLVHDVLSKGKVDLLFFEAAVNDEGNGFTPLEQIRGVEGVVRHILETDPETDIILNHFIHSYSEERTLCGQQPDVIFNHERVANHYAIPSINLAQEISERILDGQFTWKDFGGVHPAPLGHDCYVSSMIRLLEMMWSEGKQMDIIQPHQIPTTQLDEYSYSKGDFLDIHRARLGEGWSIVDSWRPHDGASTRKGFVDVPMLETVKAGAQLTLDFEGRAIGICCVAGPSAGTLEYSVDGSPFKSLDTFTHWSTNLYIPWVYMFETELRIGPHRLVVRMSPQHNERSKGTACQIRDFVVNK